MSVARFLFEVAHPKRRDHNSIEYPIGEEPIVFLSSKDCFYRLHAPNKGYKEVFKTFQKKVSLTKRVLEVVLHLPQCTIVDLAK